MSTLLKMDKWTHKFVNWAGNQNKMGLLNCTARGWDLRLPVGHLVTNKGHSVVPFGLRSFCVGALNL